MDYELRLVVEKLSDGSQSVVKRDALKVYDVTAPESILHIGKALPPPQYSGRVSILI